jgi:hypothetical protein
MKLRAMLALLCLLAGVASAHEVRPAYLELRQTGAETYDVLWKVPARGDDLRFGLYAELPAGTVNLTEPRGEFLGGSFVERWSARRPGGFDGATIHVVGLSATRTDVLVRVERQDGTTQVGRVTPDAPDFVVTAAASAFEVALTYLKLGVEVGQLIFIAAALTVITLARRIPIGLPAWAWRVPPYAIGAVASFWLIERLAAFGS